MKATIIAALAVVVANSSCDRLNPTADAPAQVVAVAHELAQAKLDQLAKAEEADARLGQYAINMMYWAGAKDKLSDGRKQILARAIVRVSNDIFETEDNKKAFIAVIAIESAFNRFAQSPTGPKGYAQLAKASFHEAMADCGVTGLRDDDVWETDFNLYAGACYFRKTLEAFNGDPYAAIVAYNQGPNSEAAKTYAKHGRMENVEALKYVARFSFLKRRVTDEKTPETPAIQDLPKPTASANLKQ
jgi:soluble lytic murein transglycosylase-like protein